MDTSAAPRIAPGTRRQIGWLTQGFSHIAGRVGGTTPPNLFLTLGRHKKLFRGWLHFAGRLMPGGTLPRRETELMILRVAHLRACSYEFDHHVHLGKRAGVTATDVARVQAGPSVDGWSPREQALLATVDALHERQDLDDTEWDALRRHVDEKTAIEVLLLVGHYEMLATAITTLRLAPDQPRRAR